MTIRQALVRAAQKVEAGWCQGEMSTPDGRVCIYGAIEAVAGDPFLAVRMIRRVREVVGRDFLGVWNDEPERTQQDVVRALRQAARI